jgi:outer membrane receptor protein involved in Fe transport
MFLSDQYSLGKVTLNLGIRWDGYKAHVPDQEQLAFEIFPGCASRMDIICAVPAATIGAKTMATWNSVVPRAGLVFDLTGDGKTVLKANYGLFRHNPGALQGTVTVDPDLKQPYSHEASVFIEREIAA